jgi:hypothetical protein
MEEKLEKLERYADAAWENLNLQQKLEALDEIGVIGAEQALKQWAGLKIHGLT